MLGAIKLVLIVIGIVCVLGEKIFDLPIYYGYIAYGIAIFSIIVGEIYSWIWRKRLYYNTGYMTLV